MRSTTSEMKQKLHTLADVLVTLVIYYLVGVAAHEFWHCRIAEALGYGARACFPSWISGFVVVEPFPTDPLHIALIGVAGGGGVALLYALISHFTADWETDLVLWFFAPLHGFYAVCEVFYVLRLLPLWALGALPVPPALVVLLWKLRQHGYL